MRSFIARKKFIPDSKKAKNLSQLTATTSKDLRLASIDEESEYQTDQESEMNAKMNQVGHENVDFQRSVLPKKHTKAFNKISRATDHIGTV